MDTGVDLFPLKKPKSRNTKICFVNVRRVQHKCGQAHKKSDMDFSSPIISLLLHFLLLISLVCPVYSLEINSHLLANESFAPHEEFNKLKNTIRFHLQKINKPFVKTIQVCY